MTAGQIAERNAMLKYAIAQFNAKAPNTWVYLDAGNAGWIGATAMAQQLAAAGVGGAHGFALNVSNYFTTDQNSSYGNAVNSALRSLSLIHMCIRDRCCCGSRSPASPTETAASGRAPRPGSSCRRSPTR